MKQFNLEEFKKDPSRKVVTRENMPVRIICTDANGNYPVVGLILCDGEDVPDNYTENGRSYNNNQDSVNDLFFVPNKREGWVNIYKGITEETSSYAGQTIYKSKNEALKNKISDNYITTTKIEWKE